MANFSTALVIALNHEGVYSNNPADPGLETCEGISRHFHPDWSGWKIVDSYKFIADPKAFAAKLVNDANLQDLVRVFYIDYSWAEICGDEIDSQLVANKFFDQTLPMGVVTTIKIMQQACADNLKDRVECPSVDGIVGSMTIGAINGIMASTLLPVFIDGCVAHYQANSKPEFVAGLIRRARS